MSRELEQLTIFSALHGAPQPRTSALAAEAIKGKPAAKQRRRVLGCILMNHPITDEEIAELTGINPSSIRPRRGELLSAGHIRKNPLRKRTKAGRWAQTWEPTEGTP